MKIACFDDSESLERIENLMKEYFALRNGSAEIDSFSDTADLLKSVSVKYYDLIFLKSIYSGTAGRETSGKIRSIYPYANIVFLNKIDENTIESTFFRPEHCLMNIVQQESFFLMMSEISKSVSGIQQRIGIKTIDGAFRMIPVSDIICGEVSGHTISIHLNSGETLKIIETMKKFSGNLTAYPGFIMPHRSYIVNIIYISHITADTVYLKYCNVTVPIAKGKLNAVKEAYKGFYD